MSFEESIKQLQYHWFWGIRFMPETNRINLWVQVEALRHQPDDVKIIRQKQVEIALRIWLIRLFYWVFNIANYAANHYKLAAYYLLTDTLRMASFMNLNTQEPRKIAAIIRGFNLIAYMNQEDSTERPEEASSEENSQESNASRQTPKSVVTSGNTVKKECIAVDGWMLDYLTILRIQKGCGATLSFLELRRAYLKRAIETHPDKHPNDKGAKTIFQSVIQAYEILSEAFDCVLVKTTWVSQEKAELWAEMNELERDIMALQNEFERQIQSFSVINKQLELIDKRMKEQDRQLEEIRQEIEKRELHRTRAAAQKASARPAQAAEIIIEQLYDRSATLKH